MHEAVIAQPCGRALPTVECIQRVDAYDGTWIVYPIQTLARTFHLISIRPATSIIPDDEKHSGKASKKQHESK